MFLVLLTEGTMTDPHVSRTTRDHLVHGVLSGSRSSSLFEFQLGYLKSTEVLNYLTLGLPGGGKPIMLYYYYYYSACQDLLFGNAVLLLW